MAIIEIPLPQVDGEGFTIAPTLSGVIYRISFGFIVRDGSWFMTLADAGGTPIAAGIRAIVNYSLFSRITDSRKPPGKLMLVDTGQKGLEPGPADLGQRVHLVYDDGL